MPSSRALPSTAAPSARGMRSYVCHAPSERGETRMPDAPSGRATSALTRRFVARKGKGGGRTSPLDRYWLPSPSSRPPMLSASPSLRRAGAGARLGGGGGACIGGAGAGCSIGGGSGAGGGGGGGWVVAGPITNHWPPIAWPSGTPAFWSFVYVYSGQ